MRIRRIAGTACIVFGALNILNFWSPIPIPTVGASAFIAGALFIGLGLFIRAPRDDAGSIEWRRLADLFHVGGMSGDKTKVKALRLAAESKGKLTVSQAAMSLNVPLDRAPKPPSKNAFSKAQPT